MKKPSAKPKAGAPKKRSRADAPVPDRRAFEKSAADVVRLLNAREFASVEEMNAFLRGEIGHGTPPPPPETPLERAQALVYEAWDADGERRAALAREALEISPDCADAYVLLGEETATTPREAAELYEQGVRAGERALGPEFFEENAGHFWAILETRPYMRARASLASALEEMGEHERAVEHFEELMRLNPGDNQGLRYLLARLIFNLGDDERLGRLLDGYPEDESAEWQYTRALRLFRIGGESSATNDALAAAFESNPLVALYLLSVRELPDTPPAHYTPGDENEAALYVGFAGAGWWTTRGAMEWFVDRLERAIAADSKAPRPTRGKRPSRARATTVRPSASTGPKVYQLKVTLRGTKPPVWRRLLVPANTTLWALHNVLQIAMGWTDSHLHMFRAGRVNYGVPDPDDWDEVLDESRVTLDSVLKRVKSKLVYEYDFGDGWEHEVVVEKITAADPVELPPRCVTGRRACPPEDCGGPWGYANMLAAVEDPSHPEHAEMFEWSGDFDPTAFDAREITEQLRSLRS